MIRHAALRRDYAGGYCIPGELCPLCQSNNDVDDDDDNDDDNNDSADGGTIFSCWCATGEETDRESE